MDCQGTHEMMWYGATENTIDSAILYLDEDGRARELSDEVTKEESGHVT